MKKLLLFISMLSIFLGCSPELKNNEYIATYQYDVEDGYIYIDEQGYDVFIDELTLDELGANKEQSLLLTMNEEYEWEIDYIEIYK